MGDKDCSNCLRLVKQGIKVKKRDILIIKSKLYIILKFQ